MIHIQEINMNRKTFDLAFLSALFVFVLALVEREARYE